MKVWNKNTFSGNDPMGTGEFFLQKLRGDNASEEIWVDLKPGSYELQGHTNLGKLKIRINFVPSGMRTFRIEELKTPFSFNILESGLSVYTISPTAFKLNLDDAKLLLNLDFSGKPLVIVATRPTGENFCTSAKFEKKESKETHCLIESSYGKLSVQVGFNSAKLMVEQDQVGMIRKYQDSVYTIFFPEMFDPELLTMVGISFVVFSKLK